MSKKFCREPEVFGHLRATMADKRHKNDDGRLYDHGVFFLGR